MGIKFFLSATVANVEQANVALPDWSALITNALITGVVIAALISALVALIGMWVSYQNAKISAQITRENARLSASLEAAKRIAESRQNWIDQMRQDMSEFSAVAGLKATTKEADESWKRDVFERHLMISARITMRMNPLDPDYKQLQDLLSACSTSDDVKAVAGAAREFIKVGQQILKREWDVLKAELVKIAEVEEKK